MFQVKNRIYTETAYLYYFTIKILSIYILRHDKQPNFQYLYTILLLAVLEHWKCESREVPQTFNSWVVCFSVRLSVCLSVYKNAIFITGRHRNMSQIYVKYSLYIQSYYFNFTFARASLWRVQLCNQWCNFRGICFFGKLWRVERSNCWRSLIPVCSMVFSTTHCQLNTVALVYNNI